MGFSLFKSDWENVVDQERNDLVFEQRNQSYGAYVIRREYDRAVIIAMIIASSFVIGGFITPLIINYFSTVPVEELKNEVSIIEFVTPPLIEKEDKIIIPIAAEPVKPVQQSIQFTVPVVEDEKIQPAIIPDQGIENPGTSTTTFTGDPGDIIIPDKPSTTGSIIGDAPKETFIIVEKMPLFPGGEEAMMKFIQGKIHYPELEKSNGIEGVVYMSFIVDYTGKVKDIAVLRGIKGGNGLEQEATRVLSLMPQWEPGMNNGHPVNVQFNLPVQFKLR